MRGPLRFAPVPGWTAVFLAAAAALSAGPALVAAQPERRPFLFKDSRGELAQARARGDAGVVLVIASMPGRNVQVAAAVEGAGGRIGFRHDEVDYLRAWVPLEQAQELAAHPDVHSADVSITNRPRSFALAGGAGDATPQLPAQPLPALDRPSPGAGRQSIAGHQRSRRLPIAAPPSLPVALPPSRSDTIWPPVLGDHPLRNRYSPLADIRALAFRRENPTWDGRGTTIAMIDMSPDMLLPELQTATALDGSPVPKVAVYRNALDPEIEDDGRWLHMDDVVTAAGGRFSYRDTLWTAPRDGVFRVAMFDEAKADTAGIFGAQGLDEDVNRDGNPEGSSRLFGVLWDEDAGDVWVDVDQDFDLAEEPVLGEYDQRSVFGVFGSDDPETPVRESVGFGVQIDAERKRVALNLGIASHATLVVGAAMASRGENGRFEGVAPGARLASVAEGGSAYGQTEAVIVAAANPEVDVIYFEQSSNITRTYLLRDGRLVPSVIYDRLVERYGPSILSPTHNFPVLGAIDDIVMGRGVIGVGGHESKANFFMNHGVRVEHDDNLLITGGYGPMGDGMLKPDVISPSNYVSTAQGFVEGRAIPGLFQLPPGYTIAGGTSTATPTAAAAVALLISAARQAGVAFDPYRLKYAVSRGARWVPHIAAYKQGNGVISVAGAWDVLTALDAGGLSVEIESRAPVETPYAHLLATPHQGVGLYERSGWRVGERGVRTVELTRRSGPSGPMTFAVEWDGNAGDVFSSPPTVVLPLDVPTTFSVTATPREHGVHTAHLTLRHDDVTGYAHRMLAAIVTPEPLEAGNDWTARNEVQVPRPGMQSLFFSVPEGADALKLELSWEERPVALSVVRPDTRAQRGQRVRNDDSGVVQVVADPMPGTWEVRLSDIADVREFDWEQAKKEEPVPPTPATLTVSALSVELDAIEGDDGSGRLSAVNRMAAFTGAVAGLPAGSARRESRWIAAGEQHVYEVEAPPGSRALMARTWAAGSDEAEGGGAPDLDVYVFDCTGDECRSARVDGDPVGDESVIVHRPAAGTWKVIVDAAAMPADADSARYEYLDVVFNPSFGATAATDVPQERAVGARWTTEVQGWAAPAVHGEGRSPYLAVVLEGLTGSDAWWTKVAEAADAR